MILTPDRYVDALEFVTTHVDRVYSHAKILMNLLGLNHFIHSHIERKNPKTLVSLHANTFLSTFWVEQGMPLPVALPNGFYLASEFQSLFPEGMLTLIREELATDHILFYVQHNRESTDVFSVGSDPENKLILSHYINHAQTLKDFFLYFKQETRSLLKESCQHAFDYDFSVKKQKKIFPGKIIIPDCNGFSSLDDVAATLSKREFECLALKSSSLSMKSIAQQLKINTRTVEYYLVNAKDKLNCSNPNEMVELYHTLNRS